MRYQIIGIRRADNKEIFLSNAWTEDRAWQMRNEAMENYSEIYSDIVVDYPWWTNIL